MDENNKTHEPHEIVVVDLGPSTRLRVTGQIDDRMIEKGFGPKDFAALDLGLDLRPCWPLTKMPV